MPIEIDDLPPHLRAQARAQIAPPTRTVGQDSGEAVLAEVVSPAEKVSPAETLSDILEMTPPDGQQKRRRNLRIEWAEQVAYFDQINARLDQKALAAGFYLALPEYPGADLIFAIQGENAAGEKIGQDLKKAGRRAGIPDIFVAVPRQDFSQDAHIPYAGCWIEMKQPAGLPSDVRKTQTDWHERLRKQSYKVCVAYGWREAMAITENYLGWKQ